MPENKDNYEAGFSSDVGKQPRRIVFITRKTSAKVRGETGRQVMSYPHLVLREMIVFEVLTVVLVLLALVWDAPLEQLANPLHTPNPAKAPWYFLGLQELLHYFPPLVAGIIIPTLVVVALVVIPYFHVNVRGEPLWARNPPRRLGICLAIFALLFAFLSAYRAWTALVPSAVIATLLFFSYLASPEKGRCGRYLKSRPVSWWVMTWFITVAVVLTVVGTFFRGPGWSWVWPWGPHGV